MLRSDEAEGAVLRSDEAEGAVLRSDEAKGAVLRTDGAAGAVLRRRNLTLTPKDSQACNITFTERLI